jgi:phage gpG-like protein
VAVTFTPYQAADRLKQFAFAVEALVTESFTKALVEARRLATEVYMVRGPKNAPPRPDKLTRRSGALARSVKILRVRRIGKTAWVGGLEAGNANVEYAAIHEFGGRTGPHVINPLRGSVLSWRGPNGPVFARQVNHPGSKFPPRPYIRPSITDVANGLAETVERGIASLKQRFLGE